MSVAEVLLPSPPPENGPPDHMSGLFSRPAQHEIPSDALSELNEVESDLAARKRVEFHPWTTNISEPQLSTPDSEVPPSLRSLPPSRSCQQRKRPILKATSSVESVLGFDGQNEKKTTFEDMNSLLEQLANNDRLSSLDAYQTMLNLIKMYERPPEEAKLKEKMTSLQKYIKRDLLVLDKDIELLPSEIRLSMQNLIIGALKILVTIVWISSYASCLTDDFRLWTVERAIQVLRDRSASKPVILHYMHFLAMQNYPDAIVASGKRASQLLDALQELPDHVSGKAVIAERLLVYQRLFDQARSTMKARPDLWVKNLMTAMSHSFKEVRSNAISLGTRACTIFGGAANIADEARKVLAEPKGERTLSASTTNRLESILAAKDEANQIPQIWAIVLMLCNSNQHRLETWVQFEDWVRLIQRCFNCSDVSIKTQAYMAWTRLYYVARPHQASDQLLPLLAKPAVLHLEKTGNNPSKGTRQAVMSSYAMLLYYAFRPAANHQQHTRMWNEFVVKIMTRKFLSSSTSNCDLCCRVLSALFHSSLGGTRVWNEHRGLENAPLDPLELPAIDCKWIRQQISPVLAIIELLVQYSSFGPDGELSEQAYIAQAWRSLMKAIREGSSKEVVTSSETKAALSCITQFLKPRQPENTLVEDPLAFNVRLALLSRITIAELAPSLARSILESLTGTGNITVVRELMLMLSHENTDSNLVEHRTERLFDRCLSFWSKELDASGSTMILEASNDILTHIAPEKATQALVKIQRQAASLIEDESQHFTLDEMSSGYDTAYYTFCVSVVDLLAGGSPSSYGDLDDLIASVLATRHTLLRTRLLQSWGGRTWDSEQHSYGPRLLRLLTESPNRLEIKLPGFSMQNTADRAHSSTTNTGSGKKQFGSSSAATPARTKDTVNREKAQSSKGKQRHNNSQISFVPIESSPLSEVFESQLLTAHQKEVRERQQTEPPMTFADIRSSSSTGKKKKKRVRSAEAADEAEPSPQLPATPTFPHNKTQDDRDEQPTPTPRTRKSLRQQLQPDITSSPSSIRGDNERPAAADVITSSPVKDSHEGEDTIQLNVLPVSEPRKQLPGVRVLVPKLSRAASTVVRDEHGGRLSSPEIDLSDVADIVSGASQEKFDTVEPELSTPASYSDEYDALAASQLSHNLEEQSSTATREVQETPTSQGKRKRTRDAQAEGGKKKKRKSSGTLAKVAEPPVQAEDNADLDDCIVVNTDDVTPVFQVSPARSSQQAPIRPERRRPGRSHQNQVPRSGATDASPSSQETPGKRKKKSGSSSQRKSRSRHSSREASVSSPPISNFVDNFEKAIENVEMDTEHNQSELPSLGSEVMETVQSEITVTIEQAPSGTGAAAQPQQTAAVEEANKAHGVILSLQDILHRMSDANSELKPSEQELALIHSLCFKIGLKAQELA
ncbi:hypothetical protein H2198_006365 [Neophaeococcomyces mojaviensis]|uniref:Uncharacterized protein n=1 Tax=Neophaeococcomyces mojaviensis TaxID=3383035 RepID=A0ACC3A351_9EURO|nr:hypothetical protein H2198_006365 [Knufia sp. JES_112]